MIVDFSWCSFECCDGGGAELLHGGYYNSPLFIGEGFEAPRTLH